MTAFNEKCDSLLYFLNENKSVDWHTLFTAIGLKQNEGIISYLKKIKGFIDYSNDGIHITQAGIDFISSTSFTEIRDSPKLNIARIDHSIPGGIHSMRIAELRKEIAIEE